MGHAIASRRGREGWHRVQQREDQCLALQSRLGISTEMKSKKREGVDFPGIEVREIVRYAVSKAATDFVFVQCCSDIETTASKETLSRADQMLDLQCKTQPRAHRETRREGRHTTGFRS